MPTQPDPRVVGQAEAPGHTAGLSAKSGKQLAAPQRGAPAAPHTDTEFVVANSGGVTDYPMNQALFDLTATPWAGFHFELGFGVGAGFVRAGAGDGLGFDLESPAPTAASPSFASAVQGPRRLQFSSGWVTGPAPATFAFTIDVPDDLASWNPEGQSRFSRRQMPVLPAVPEPATAVLLFAGSPALLGRRMLHQRGLREWAHGAAESDQTALALLCPRRCRRSTASGRRWRHAHGRGGAR